MKSMTGFGSSSLKSKNFQIFLSIKSVNSRFMDIKYYLPSFYSALESEFQKIVYSKCTRGQFVVRIHRVPQYPSTTLSLKWNKDKAIKWKKIYQNAARDLQIKNTLSITDIMKQTGVVDVIESPVNLSINEKNQVKKCFQTALNACVKERAREGVALKKDIVSHVKSIQIELKKIKNFNLQQKQKYSRQKSKKNDGDYEIEKIDINEEIVRMEEHLKHLKLIAESAKSSGKKMDFYVQEILREINTVGSKSQLSALTRCVVEVKFTLDKIKEQVQNIE